MADSSDVPGNSSGFSVEVNGSDEVSCKTRDTHRGEETLYSVFHRLVSEIFFPDQKSSYGSSRVLHRIKPSLIENVPLLRQAVRNTGHNVLAWTRRGSPLRALLVISVGAITLLALMGLLVFMLFFLAATVNAIVICLLMSLAAAGAFLAVFFACVTAIYIGALSVAVFVISTGTISAIIAVVIATGWVGFFCAVWLAAKKGMGLAKQSLSLTGSAISAYSSARHVRQHHEPGKDSD